MVMIGTSSKPTLIEMVFCSQNSSDQEKLLKFEAEGREFAKILIPLEQCIGTVGAEYKGWSTS